MQPIITWNLDWWQRAAPQPQRVPVITSRSDAVWLVQEMKRATFRSVMEAWPGSGVSALDVYEPAKPSWMACGVFLPPGYEVLNAGVVDGLPRPQRGMWVETASDVLGAVTFVTWHTENAASDQRRKMACYRAMHDWLEAREGATVLGFDANSWLDPVDLRPADPEGDYFEEHDFLGSDARHGLTDAHRRVMEATGELDRLRQERPDGPLAVSYVLSNGVAHRMDRIFVGDEFDVEASSYDYEQAVGAGSDHAIHEVVLRRRPDSLTVDL